MELDKPSWASRTTLVKNHDENKTYILVKLSESFSNAIQEYSAAQNNNINNHHHNHHQQQQQQQQQQQNNHKSHNNNVKSKHYPLTKEPTIKFQGTRGAIKFPDGKSYDFSLEPSDNPVECIRQTKSKWETVGRVACCLQVKGKDDVYQMTKTKLKAAEQEKRKYCAKLLGSPEHNNSISNNNKKTKLLNNSNPIKPILPPPSIPPSTTTTTTTININPNLKTQHDHQSKHKKQLEYNNHNHNHNDHNIHHKNNNQDQPPSSKTTHNNNTTNNNIDALPPQSKYPEIEDVKQLKKYKAEFDKDFQEYQNLHGYLHRIEERFRKLRELLKQSVEGSPDWESAKEEIFNEYERVKSDSNFHVARREYKQLCNKLAHIKEKIFQFKQRKKDLSVLKQKQQQPPSKPKQNHNHHQRKQQEQQQRLQEPQHQVHLQQQHHHHSSKKHQKHKHQQQRLQK